MGKMNSLFTREGVEMTNRSMKDVQHRSSLEQSKLKPQCKCWEGAERPWLRTVFMRTQRGSHVGNSLASAYKVKHTPAVWSGISTSAFIQEKLNPQRFVWIFISAVFIITKNREAAHVQPLVSGRTSWIIDTGEYSSVRRSKPLILPHLKSIMQSERSKTQKAMYGLVPFLKRQN